jgi:hypothetical protein
MSNKAFTVRPLKRISQLRSGVIVRNKGDGYSFVVLENYGNHAVAVREVSIMNPSEWQIVIPAERVRRVRRRVRL